jgi:hypothetical protein
VGLVLFIVIEEPFVNMYGDRPFYEVAVQHRYVEFKGVEFYDVKERTQINMMSEHPALYMATKTYRPILIVLARSRIVPSEWKRA